MDATQKRVQDAVTNLVDDLDRLHVRGIQKTMYLCSARCCEDATSSRETLEKCVDLCNVPAKKAQSVLESELHTFQDQITRCSMTCYDKQVQLFGPDPNKYSEEQLATFSRNLDKCVDECATTHIALLGKIRDRIGKQLK